ncbi:MAG: hypothetical protein IKU25_08495 [Clostridia bacterium]|nr:hypothetical protein [Clostridia bacterium]
MLCNIFGSNNTIWVLLIIIVLLGCSNCNNNCGTTWNNDNCGCGCN